MKLPEKAPKLQDIFAENRDLLTKKIPDTLLKKLIDDYDYWTEFKHTPLPPEITPEVAWARRELESTTSRKYLPFTDKDGKEFSFWLTPKTQPILHFIDRDALAFPISDKRDEADKTKYLLASLMEEAIASSQIEGAATTRRVAKEMLASKKTPKNKSEWMIFNNYKAITHISEQDSKRELSEEMLLNLHKILAENTLEETDAVGRFRLPAKDNDISVYDADGNILHKPYPAEKVQNEVKKLIEFANQKHDGVENEFIHPAVKAIILHFWFAYIHPFVDGNGRTARALFYWFMLKNKYWIFEYISISKLVLKMSGQYKKAFLYSECSENDLTYFILFNLDIIEKSIKDVIALINKKEAQQKRNRFIMDKYPNINSRQRDILINAVKNPNREYKIATHRGFHNIAYATAREDFAGLVKLGLLEKRLIGKTSVFMPVKDIQSKLSK